MGRVAVAFMALLVSILVVLDLALQRVGRILTVSLFCFNPCCIGFSVATWLTRLRLGVLVVSILVVLDLALQHWQTTTTEATHVSILVVLDLALQPA